MSNFVCIFDVRVFAVQMLRTIFFGISILLMAISLVIFENQISYKHFIFPAIPVCHPSLDRLTPVVFQMNCKKSVHRNLFLYAMEVVVFL